MAVMGRRVLVLGFFLLVLLGGASSAPTFPQSKIVSGYFSNLASVFMKWLWSLKATTKAAVSGRPMVKFESGFTVETVFDGSKLGIEPHTVEMLTNGEILILDSANSNIYRMYSRLTLNSRPKLVAGSPEGYSGHIDGKPREARMNHPKGLTVDDRGNIYVADTVNMAIRKISDTGVTTIAGGKLGHGGSHVDGPSEDAKFSNDFDVIYIGSSCSLLVIDRGNRAIREIQLHFDDCAYQYESGFPLGIVVLLGAAFFGYMLALLQRRVGTIVSSQNDESPIKPRMPLSSYQEPLKSVMPPLIPTEEEQEKQEEGFVGSLGKLLVNAWASVLEILGKKQSHYEDQRHQQQQQQQKYSNTWPVQDSYVIPDEDEAPTIETRTPTPRKTYAFMAKDAETIHQLRQSRNFYNDWGDNQQQQPKQQQHHHRHQSSTPQTFYEQSCDQTTEIVFGAVQEQAEAVVIKPIDYGDPMLYHRSVGYQFDSMGYPRGY